MKSKSQPSMSSPRSILPPGHRCASLVAALLSAVLLFAGASRTIAAAGGGAADGPNPTGALIPFDRFTLKNGLTVLVHQDHKVPVVCVDVWYQVGAKNEPAGRSGFAHLFEHLLFQGSEHKDTDYIQTVERLGATDLNGTTWYDRTTYFETVPRAALDRAMWLESDRMGHLLPAMTQAKLDEQRGVVQNEKRQGENLPYGKVFEAIEHGLYPSDHPYRHGVIGSMDDLNAAKLDDVKEWFTKYYGPNNAILILAGDIDLATAKEKAELYFGDIPPGPPLAKVREWVPRWEGLRRQTMQDRVPQARLHLAWNVPPFGTADYDYLSLAGTVLGGGKASRLYERLAIKDGIATDASYMLFPLEITAPFVLEASAQPGAKLGEVEKAVFEELTRFIKDGPTAEELNRAKTRFRADFIRGIEKVGGMDGKAAVLATYEAYRGDGAAYQTVLKRVQSATTKDLQGAVKRWLSDSCFALEVHSFGEVAASETKLDRAKEPPVEKVASPAFPAPEEATLANGLRLLLVKRGGLPLVNLSLRVNAGFATDVLGAPGLASLAVSMLEEGTETRDSRTIARELDRLGAVLDAGARVDVSRVRLSVLKDQLKPAFELMSDIVVHPSFPTNDLERLRRERLASIEQERADSYSIGMKLLPGFIYGPTHPHGLPLSGIGTAASVAALGREDLRKWHRTWFRPNASVLLAVGDLTMAELKTLAQAGLGAWQSGEIPKLELGDVKLPAKARVVLVDRPDSESSQINVGQVMPAVGGPDEMPLQIWMQIVAGEADVKGVPDGFFGARINQNLREQKHWSYGAYGGITSLRGQRPLIIGAPVQTDKTKESIEEMRRELTEAIGAKPVTQAELDAVKNQQTLGVAGVWEEQSSLLVSLGMLVERKLPFDYFNGFADRIRALTLDDVNRAGREALQPDKLVWLVVGDRKKIEAGLRELAWAELEILDADGKPVAAPAAK